MKFIIALILGIVSFYYSFSGANYLIHYVCQNIIDTSLHSVMVIVLWVVCFGLILKVSLFGSIMVMQIIVGKD